MKITKPLSDIEALCILIGIRERQYRFTKFKKHQNIEKKKEELFSIWCKTHPLASWSILHQALVMMGETEAAKSIQTQYLKGRNSYILMHVTCVIIATTFIGHEREAEINIMQTVFTGPPRVGKSSFWKRLLGMMPERHMPSTDIISEEGNVRLDIRGSCGFTVNVSKLDWKKLQAEEEFDAFVALVTQTQDASKFEIVKHFVKKDLTSNLTKSSDQPQTNASVDIKQGSGAHTNQTSPTNTAINTSRITSSSKKVTSDPKSKTREPHSDSITTTSPSTISSKSSETVSFNAKVVTPSTVLQQAMLAMKRAEVTRNVDSMSFVYFTDTGGQPEFQELLPVLMAGCNTVFIIFNLEQDLDSYPQLEYLPSNSNESICYQSPYTVGEMLCQSLMSIPIKDKVHSEVTSSFVFFIGTHKDIVTSQKIYEMNKRLVEIISKTPQYQSHMVQNCGPDNITFAVDNFSSLKNDEDFLPIRRVTQNLLYGETCFSMKVPTLWLFVCIVLQKLGDSHLMISLQHCKEITQKCGIEDKDVVSCLKFLHQKIGVIRFYSTVNLCNIVFLKPQLIINHLSQLMRISFKKDVASRAVMTEKDVEEVVNSYNEIPKDLLFQITRDLLFSAPHPDTTAESPKHYLTCMLPVKAAAQDDHDPTALLFTLEGFVLPTGIGRSIITSILQRRMNTRLPWKISYQSVFRNSLEFTAGTSNVSFMLQYTSNFLRLSVLNKANLKTGICVGVRRCIESAMTEVLQLYSFKDTTLPMVGFFCSECDSKGIDSHMTTLTKDGNLECSETKCVVAIPDNLQHWFKVG